MPTFIGKSYYGKNRKNRTLVYRGRKEGVIKRGDYGKFKSRTGLRGRAAVRGYQDHIKKGLRSKAESYLYQTKVKDGLLGYDYGNIDDRGDIYSGWLAY